MPQRFSGPTPAPRARRDPLPGKPDPDADQDQTRRCVPGDAIVDASVAGSDYASLKRAWVIEPIGGTDSFARGIPFYGVSVTYPEDDRCEAGVIYDPHIAPPLAGAASR